MAKKQEECNDDCNFKADSCSVRYIEIDGQIYKRDTSYFDHGKRCHDCGIKNIKGNTHHINCDMERCPKCKGQLLSCKCNKQGFCDNNFFYVTESYKEWYTSMAKEHPKSKKTYLEWAKQNKWIVLRVNMMNDYISPKRRFNTKKEAEEYIKKIEGEQ